MRITFLIRSLFEGGAERQLVTLCKALGERGHRVSVGVFYPGGSFENDLKEFGIKICNLKKSHRWDILLFFRKLISFLIKENPDIIYAFFGPANLSAVILKPFFPKAAIVWGIRASDMDFSHYHRFVHFASILERMMSRFPDLIISNSHAGMKDSIHKGFPGTKMVVIPNGIDTDKFRPDKEARVAIRKEWGVSGNEILVGMVGRVDPMKDYMNFLKSASIALKFGHNLRFACIGRGDGPYYNNIRQYCNKLEINEHVIWCGRRNDMQKVYCGLDILCLSSAFGEGFPNVLGEAMACGVPCIATEVGDSTEVIGGTGITVPPRDPAKLAEKIISMMQLVESDRDILSEKVRNRIVNSFSVEKLVIRTEEILSKINSIKSMNGDVGSI